MDIELTRAAWPVNVSLSSQAWFTDKLNEALDELSTLRNVIEKLEGQLYEIAHLCENCRTI